MKLVDGCSVAEGTGTFDERFVFGSL